MCWWCADGNKLFQSEFINVIHPGSSLVPLLEYNLLNSSVALFGYYFAAFTIDKLWMGRRRMQVTLNLHYPESSHSFLVVLLSKHL